MRTCVAAFAIMSAFAADTAVQKRLAAVRVFGNPGQAGLFVADADGSNERPLLGTAATDYDAAWAPDGSSIVFTSERDGSADLYRVKPDGSSLERLTNDPAYDDQAAFSSDAKHLVFVSTRKDGTPSLWILDIATKQVRGLTSSPGRDYRPAWSPDGKWIAFSSGRGEAAPFAHGRWERLQLAEIYIIRPDGSNLRKITKTGNFCGSPKWTTDSKRLIAYCMTSEQTLANRRNPEPGSETRLVSIDTVNGKITDVAAGAGVKINPSALGNGEIGYIRKDKADPGAGIYYTSGRRGPAGDIRTASWSPDGKRVVFHKRLNPKQPAIQTVFSHNANFELSLTATILPAFSPTGDRFVTSSRPPGAEPFGANLLMTTVGTGQTEIVHSEKTRNVLGATWSPRGDRIIFSVGEFPAFFDGFRRLFLKTADRVESGAQVAMVNSDGSGFEELTSGGSNNAFPSFAPDGNRFVYRTFEKSGYGLRIMNLETKHVTTLTKAYDNFPLWSPRGDLIMFSRLVDGAYEIFTVKPDGSSLKRLTNTHGNDAHQAWSPDGEWIAFASSRRGFKDEVVYTDAPQPYGELFVMRFDGTQVEQITDNQWEEGTPAWRPVVAATPATGGGSK